jgi:glycosyltransferase involved in cell wall biosynthesis
MPSKAKPRVVPTTPTRPIAVLSNAPWTPTGYGEQTQQLVRRLKADGHPIAVFANYGLEGSTMEWEGIPVYPRGIDVYSNDVGPAHAMAWGREFGVQPLVITLFDVWVLQGAGWDVMERVASWVPIDHMPCPPAVAGWLSRPNVTPIAMSKFGHDMIRNLDVESLYVPHAIDTSIFSPTERTPEGATGREWMGVPEDAYVVGIVSANKDPRDRKSFAEMFLATSALMKERDDVWLYLHTEVTSAMNGLDLRALAQACGLPQDRVKWADPYSYRMGIPKETLASLYTGMDVLLQTSRGEGFGIPAIEAQACGTPVIVSNATAQPELAGDGWCVEVQPLWDAAQGAWFFTPLVGGILDALRAAHDRGRGRSQKAVNFAAQYDADAVYASHWKPALEVLLP